MFWLWGHAFSLEWFLLILATGWQQNLRAVNTSSVATTGGEMMQWAASCSFCFGGPVVCEWVVWFDPNGISWFSCIYNAVMWSSVSSILTGVTTVEGMLECKLFEWVGGLSLVSGMPGSVYQTQSKEQEEGVVKEMLKTKPLNGQSQYLIPFLSYSMRRRGFGWMKWMLQWRLGCVQLVSHETNCTSPDLPCTSQFLLVALNLCLGVLVCRPAVAILDLVLAYVAAVCWVISLINFPLAVASFQSCLQYSVNWLLL